MKKLDNFFALVILVLIIGVGSDASAQGRGYHRGHEKKYDNNKHDHRDRDDGGRDRDWDYRDNNHHPRGHDRRHVQHVYHHRHDRYCNHTPVVVHHYTRPRYVYYRDYDVYYDCRNNVYISYSGRSWTVSAAIPLMMRQVNIRTAKRYEVDYHDDDFPRYLERRRPSYGREYYDW